MFLNFIHQTALLWVGLLIGFGLGAWITWRVLRSEIYEYVKAARKDQDTIRELLLGQK
jgi:cytochrome c-type biogenesis protein CcmH/NrfF